MKKEIILIGPVCSGKTTLAGLIADKIGKKQISVDRIANQYYEEFGIGDDKYFKVREEHSILQAVAMRKPALIYAVEKILSENTDCVFDFGAGHSYFEEPELMSKIQSILRPYLNVILLLPSNDHKNSVEILRERSVRIRNKDWIYEGYDFIKHWVEGESNHKLSKFVVYTEGKTLDEISEEIVARSEL
jgi:nicotinamide riboside kinase